MPDRARSVPTLPRRLPRWSRPGLGRTRRRCSSGMFRCVAAIQSRGFSKNFRAARRAGPGLGRTPGPGYAKGSFELKPNNSDEKSAHPQAKTPHGCAETACETHAGSSDGKSAHPRGQLPAECAKTAPEFAAKNWDEKNAQPAGRVTRDCAKSSLELKPNNSDGKFAHPQPETRLGCSKTAPEICSANSDGKSAHPRGGSPPDVQKPHAS